MYIDKVRLTNIRGFKELEFSFGRGDGSYAGWTVFTGDNGAGKSTLLKAIAIALGGLHVASSLQPSFRRWVRGSQPNGRIGLDLAYEDGSGNSGGHGVEIQFRTNGMAEPSVSEVSGPVPRTLADKLRDHPAWRMSDWFSCGYGPFRRISGAAPDFVQQMSAPATERFITLFQESTSLAEVDQWLRNLNYKALEGKAEARAQLGLVLNILGDELLPNQISIDRVDSDGLWLRDRKGVQLAWGEMSDGYRAALALLADILRHLIGMYGIAGLAARDPAGKLYITSQGVVLIDEIDAHLHPEWQREIGFWLKKHFPNIQFLVTSHSPLICQAADPNGLFVLPEPGSDVPARALTPEEYREVVSSRPDTILRSAAFGLTNTRSDTAVEARAGYARLKAKERAGARLTRAETEQLGQLSLFVNTAEEP